MEVSIRKIDVSDVVTLSALAQQTFKDTFTGTCSKEDMDTFLQQYYNTNRLSNELNNPLTFCFFAEVNGMPVAYLQFMEDYTSLPIMKKWKALELKRIYVLKEYHSKGIAQKLMDYFLSFAVENKFEVVWLGVWEHNVRAQKFYEKYGFENTGHAHDFPIGNTPQTDFWFWKFLK